MDAAPARAHVARLRAFGLSVDSIAAVSGLSTSLVAALTYPKHSGWRRWLLPATRDAILGVRFDLDAVPAGRMVAAQGTRRRIEGLCAMGWPMSHLAGELGVSVAAVSSYRRRARVEAGTARRVRDLFDRLSMLPGPSVKAARAARRAGWLPPLAWDDESIDDPGAGPARPGCARDDPVDEVAVWRAAHGDPVPLRGPERAEAVRVMARLGASDRQAADVLQVCSRTVLRVRAANGIPAGVSAAS